MPLHDERPDAVGTVYGTHRARRPVLPRDPLLRFALATGLAGVLVGAFFATGVFGGDAETPVSAQAATSPAAPTPPESHTPDPTPTTVEPTPSPTPSPTPTPAGVSGPTVFRSVAAGRCVGTDGGHEKARAELADCTGAPEQQWVAAPAGPDAVTLTNAAYGQCLDVEGGSGDDGAKVQQFGCHGEGNQQWRVHPAGEAAVLLVSVASGKCAQPEGGGSDPGTDLVQLPCTGGVEQQWATG
ncbi:RICIN domain-containing protein [Micromonospora sp. SH-82]|uniref:RICIN domain-containing protein n=1 Tax=Micromonospora sp. SH-82 TaxID=3132938 RepID=UPI003EBDFD93